jgi:hypothetical protein
MAARRRFLSGRRSARRRGNLVWVTVVVQASILENTATDVALVLSPGDWDPTGVFDHATLVAVRGWISITQQGAATAADASAGYLAMYVKDDNATVVMNAGLAADYDIHDVLWTAGMGLTAAASTVSLPNRGGDLIIKTKRRISSAQRISLCAFVNTDTATPRMNINGVVRALVRTE